MCYALCQKLSKLLHFTIYKSSLNSLISRSSFGAFQFEIAPKVQIEINVKPDISWRCKQSILKNLNIFFKYFSFTYIFLSKDNNMDVEFIFFPTSNEMDLCLFAQLEIARVRLHHAHNLQKFHVPFLMKLWWVWRIRSIKNIFYFLQKVYEISLIFH